MNIVLFGANGMIGQSVLRECLAATDIEAVLSVGNKSSGQQHPKLQEVPHRDLRNVSLQGFDACFFCIEVTSNGTTEATATEKASLRDTHQRIRQPSQAHPSVDSHHLHLPCT